MGVSSVSLMHIHHNRVQLFKAGHCPKQEHNQASAFDSLDGPAEQIRRERLEILQDEHLVGITKYLM